MALELNQALLVGAAIAVVGLTAAMLSFLTDPSSAMADLLLYGGMGGLLLAGVVLGYGVYAAERRS